MYCPICIVLLAVGYAVDEILTRSVTVWLQKHVVDLSKPNERYYFRR